MSHEPSSKKSELSGKYAVLRPLGKGGMGTVYEATHRVLKKRVAVKVLHEQHSGDPSIMRRFVREATAVSALRSRYVVRVFDSDQTPDGAPFIVMELLSGHDLAAELRRARPPVEQVVDWLVQTCSAMHEAHRLGIIHRDLKPSNIFISEPDRTVRVLDFGISRLVEGSELTAGSEVLGTPNYIAPEVLQGRPADARADLYAIGVIAYRALSGHFPCEATEESGNPFASMLATVTVPARPIRERVPELPQELADAVMKSLAKDPSERFASARELAMALRPFGTSAAEFEESAESDVTGPVTDPSSFPPSPMPDSVDVDVAATIVNPWVDVSGPAMDTDRVGMASDARPPRPRWMSRRLVVGVVALGCLALAGVVATTLTRSATPSATTTPAASSAPETPTTTPPVASSAGAASSPADTSTASPPSNGTASTAADPPMPVPPSNGASSSARPRTVRAPRAPGGASAAPKKPPPHEPAAPPSKDGEILFLQ